MAAQQQRKNERKNERKNGGPGAVYLVCLDPPIRVRVPSRHLERDVGHYLGWVRTRAGASMDEALEEARQRLSEHVTYGPPRASPLIYRHVRRGATAAITQLWAPASPLDERALKNAGRRWTYCPRCTGGRHRAGASLTTTPGARLLVPAPARRPRGENARKHPRVATTPPPTGETP